MDYEDMIEEEPEPVEDEPELEAEFEPVEPRAKSPWKAFILTGFLAGLIGAAGGGYGAYAALKKFSPAPLVQAEIDLSPIETRLTRLTGRVTEAESAAKAAAMEAANKPTVDFKSVDMSNEFSAIETRLSALEAAPVPEIDPEALSALQAAQKDGFEWPETDEMEAVLNQLDERLTKLEAGEGQSFDENAAGETAEQTRASLQDLYERVATLEIAPSELENIIKRLEKLETRPSPTPVVEKIAILAFPKAQLISSVEANMDGGLIKKTLSRHIRVKDVDDPLTLIDGIEADLSAGRLGAAAEKFERLPSPVRSAGQAWYESVKASL